MYKSLFLSPLSRDLSIDFAQAGWLYFSKKTATLITSGLLLTLFIPMSVSMAKSAPTHVAADLRAININDGFANLVEAVKPAVVNISTTGYLPVKPSTQNEQFRQRRDPYEDFFHRFFEYRGQTPGNKPQQHKTTATGSGFIISSSGLVVTNNHVIENSDKIEVVFDDGTRLPATIKGVDKKTDLALLQVKTNHPLPFVKFGDSTKTKVGDWVIAIGNPFGLGGSTTSGIVSARGRNINSSTLDDFIQIDAPINRGNSGGPLFNTAGEVIGINSVIYSPNGGSVGIGFAIPSSMADNVIRQLADTGAVQRGFLGVYIQNIDDDIAASLSLDHAKGALVTKVIVDSPASKADIKVGDVILKFNGKKVKKMRDLPRLVADTNGNQKVNIQVWRDDKTIILSAVIGDDKSEPMVLIDNNESSGLGKVGLRLAPLNDEYRERYGLKSKTSGIVVIDVNPDGLAAKKGLREGDVIKRVDQSTIKTADDIKNAINTNQKAQKKSVLLLVERNDNAQYIVVPMSS